MNADKIVVNVECDQELQTQNLQMISSESLNKLRSSRYTIFGRDANLFIFILCIKSFYGATILMTHKPKWNNEPENKKIKIFVIRRKLTIKK